MCGRFTLTVNPADVMGAFQGYQFPDQFAPRYNIAPSQPILAIPNDGRNKADFFLWGLIPSWSKDPSISSRLINARGESLAEKPSFRGSMKYRRCLIPADGFFEWKSDAIKNTKTPYYIHMQNRESFAMAGLWDEWHSPDGGILRTCTIITTHPNKMMKPIHDRMPLLVDPVDFSRWLAPVPQTPEDLIPLIKPYPSEKLSAYPVSTLVNKPGNDFPECVLPAA